MPLPMRDSGPFTDYMAAQTGDPGMSEPPGMGGDPGQGLSPSMQGLFGGSGNSPFEQLVMMLLQMKLAQMMPQGMPGMGGPQPMPGPMGGGAPMGALPGMGGPPPMMMPGGGPQGGLPPSPPAPTPAGIIPPPRGTMPGNVQ